MFRIEDAIRIEKYYPPGGNGGPKNVYIYPCKLCNGEIKIKARSRLSTATGLCVSCCAKKLLPKALEKRRLAPYEALFRRVQDSAFNRAVPFSLSYAEFIELLRPNCCHYCYSHIFRKRYTSSTYSLDRKNNNVGYQADNLVTCCTRCNKGKRDLFSYDEWYGMTAYFRKARVFVDDTTKDLTKETKEVNCV